MYVDRAGEALSGRVWQKAFATRDDTPAKVGGKRVGIVSDRAVPAECFSGRPGSA